MEENLIPGFENFMEDTSVDVSVEVGDQEEVETAMTTEAEETAAEQAEVSEAVAEEEQDAAAAEMIFRRFDEIEHMKMVAEKYGVDRTFLALCNRNNVLANQFKITLPSCESFDTVGDPRSAESQACIEGLGKVLENVWEFIKKVCKKIKDFFVRLWDAIVTRLTGVDANIGRLRKAYEQRQDDEKALKGNNKDKTQTIAPTLLKKKTDEAKKLGIEAKNVADEFKKLQGSFVGLGSQSTTISEGQVDALKNKCDDIAKKLDVIKLKDKDKKGKLSDIKWSAIPGMLDDAAKQKGELDGQKATMDNIKFIAENCIKVAENAEKRDDKDAAANSKNARKYVSALNRFSSLQATITNVQMTAINEIIRQVALRIRYGSKKMAGY